MHQTPNSTSIDSYSRPSKKNLIFPNNSRMSRLFQILHKMFRRSLTSKNYFAVFNPHQSHCQGRQNDASRESSVRQENGNGGVRNVPEIPMCCCELWFQKCGWVGRCKRTAMFLTWRTKEFIAGKKKSQSAYSERKSNKKTFNVLVSTIPFLTGGYSRDWYRINRFYKPTIDSRFHRETCN